MKLLICSILLVSSTAVANPCDWAVASIQKLLNNNPQYSDVKLGHYENTSPGYVSTYVVFSLTFTNEKGQRLPLAGFKKLDAKCAEVDGLGIPVH